MQDLSHGSPLGHKGRSRSRKNSCQHNAGVSFVEADAFLGLSVELIMKVN